MSKRKLDPATAAAVDLDRRIYEAQGMCGCSTVAQIDARLAECSAMRRELTALNDPRLADSAKTLTYVRSVLNRMKRAKS
ncbi:MAG TPA: hypothetical protein VN742_09590 [Candidatus Binataceae bacterium]|nr:hypothetical protein [Candidatus Binataceae bacterium]